MTRRVWCSSAHGLLENVQKLLTTGSVSATISLSISSAEFTLQVCTAPAQAAGWGVGSLAFGAFLCADSTACDANTRVLLSMQILCSSRAFIALAVTDSIDPQASYCATARFQCASSGHIDTTCQAHATVLQIALCKHAEYAS